MFQQQAIVSAVLSIALLTEVSLASSDNCQVVGSLNQHLCQKTCNRTQCSCIMTESTPFSSCAQKCNFLSSCPQMLCSGRNTCSQNCFFSSCNMKCASSKYCSQTCVWKANCHQVTCSSTICHQVCSNCTMECLRGVDRCEQMCLGGECNMKCFAQNCRRQCSKGKCNYIGSAQSKALTMQTGLWIWSAMMTTQLLST